MPTLRSHLSFVFSLFTWSTRVLTLSRNPTTQQLPVSRSASARAPIPIVEAGGTARNASDSAVPAGDSGGESGSDDECAAMDEGPDTTPQLPASAGARIEGLSDQSMHSDLQPAGQLLAVRSHASAQCQQAGSSKDVRVNDAGTGLGSVAAARGWLGERKPSEEEVHEAVVHAVTHAVRALAPMLGAAAALTWRGVTCTRPSHAALAASLLWLLLLLSESDVFTPTVLILGVYASVFCVPAAYASRHDAADAVVERVSEAVAVVLSARHRRSASIALSVGALVAFFLRVGAVLRVTCAVCAAAAAMVLRVCADNAKRDAVGKQGGTRRREALRGVVAGLRSTLCDKPSAKVL